MSTRPAASTLEGRRARRRSSPAVGRGDAQQSAILDATESLLREQAFGSLTMAKVADAAGISRPAVYFYFGSMEELLIALVARTLDGLMGSLEAIEIDGAATPVDVLELGIRRTAEGWREHGPVLAAALDHARTVPAVRALWRSLLDRGVDLYVALITCSAQLDGRSSPRPADARRHAELAMLMVGNAFHELHAAPHARTDERKLERDLLLLVTRALQLV